MLVVEGDREKVRQSLGMRFVGSRLHSELEGHRGYPLIFPDVYSSFVRMPSLLEMGATLAEHASGGSAESDQPNVPDEFLSRHTEMYLKEAFSKETKLPVHKISIDEPLEEYGIDSVMILRMNAELEAFFGELPKTLLFEYQTIEELKDYFLENYRKVLVEKLLTLAELGFEQQQSQETLANETQLLDLQELAEERFMHQGFGPAIEEMEIAIVGMAGRFPGADDLQSFWDQLKRGYDAVGEVPEDRWDWRRFFSEGKQSKYGTYSKWGGFLSDIDRFDPLFFNISPREAELMDPQERLFLETAYATLGNAGYSRKDIEGSDMGVFVGVTWGEYTFYGMENALRGETHATDSVYASVANRVSYWLNVSGPSLALDTMCSSSFTALHYAAEGIRRGEMKTAIAGGVNLTLHPSKHILLCKDRFASTDGRCRAFGEGGDGYVPGEGVCAVMLKPLKDAVEHGDHIYAVLKGTALNHGGKTNGYSVPNPVAQGDLVRKTLERAQVDPRTLSYIEAHGTGTSLGDPIEMSGLNRAFSEWKPPKQFCPIGSVKSNIGHLEAAAGIAGLIKVLLQMEHRTLVPSIHSDHLNPNINFKETPFFVQRNLAPWPKPQREIEGQPGTFPRMAGISSFGAGGANAHVIVSEFEDTSVAPRTPLPGPKIFVLSAETEEKLREYAGSLVNYLDETFGDKSKSIDRLEYLTDLVRQRVIEGAALILEIDPDQIAADAEPIELGMDTVMMSDLHAHLCGTLGLVIPETLFNQGFSLNSIGTALVEDAGDVLMDAFGDMLPQVQPEKTEEEVDEAVKLEAIAYTLQVGRDSLQERLGFMVSSLDELRDMLDGFASGEGDKAKYSRGTVKISKNKSSMVLEGEEGRDYLRSLMERNKFGKLLQIWINGEDVDWRILYGDQLPRRVPLPTVPLDRKRHWKAVPDLYNQPMLPKLLGGAQALRSFSFSASLNAKTWFLEESPLAREGLLSGSVLLEVALAAARPQITAGMQVSDAVWVNAPLLRHADQSVELMVSFETGGFEISALDQDGNDQLLAQGRVAALAEGNWQAISLEELERRLSINMAQHEVYSSLAGSGLAYGDHFRAVSSISLGAGEALARLEVNPAEMFTDAVCHPALWEGAIQACTMVLQRERGGSWLNDGVAAFALSDRLPLAAWVHVALQPGEATRAAQFQIAFLNSAGQVLGVANAVSFEQVQVALPERAAPVAQPARPEYRLLAHGWRKDGEEPEVPASLQGSVIVLANRETANFAGELLNNLESVATVVVVPEGHSDSERRFDFASETAGKELALKIQQVHGPIVGLIDISDVYAEPQSSARIDNIGKVAFLQEMIRDLSGDHFPMHHYTRKLVAFDNNAPTLAGGDIAGLYRMLGAEYKKLQAKTIDVDLDLTDVAAFRALVFRELCIRDRVGEVCYRKGLRYLPTLREVEREQARRQQRRFPVTADKVYVVTGGTRGIGSEIAARLASQGARKLVLMGFTPLPAADQWASFVKDPNARPRDVEKVQRFLKLQQQGVEVVLYCGSLTDADRLKTFFSEVRQQLGAIGGVVHCAGSDLNNNPAFINKAPQDMAWVAEAKLPGLEALREVFLDDVMDFFVMFSSVAAVLPRLGTGIADYAYANAYLDYVAHYEKTQGRPWYRAMQWPSWRDVGMGEVKSVAYRQSGLSAMPTEDGMRLMEFALTTDHAVLLPCLTETNDFVADDLLLLKGKKRKSAPQPAAKPAARPAAPVSLDRAPVASPTIAATPTAATAATGSSPGIESWLGDLFAKELKMNPSEMDGDTDFGDYGLESILLAELVSTISNHLKVELDPSVILEFPTLNGLSQFLRETYPDKCGGSQAAPVAQAPQPVVAAVAAVSAAPTAPALDAGRFLQDWLRDLVGGELKIAPADLDIQAGFEDLGVESIMLAELTQKISDWLKVDLDPSLILEFASIEALSVHLLEAYGAAVSAKLPAGSAAQAAPTATATAAPPVAAPPPAARTTAKRGLNSRFKTRAVHTGLSESSPSRQPIAIIGMGCHFPQAQTVDAYWRNLNGGVDCITEIPPLRWNKDDFYVEQYRKGRSISKWGGFIDQVEYFDPKYFGISEEEATHMDPLVRQFLEVSAETMAHAGYGRKDLWNRKVGVYVGSRMANYGERIVDRMKTSVVGVAQNFIAAHVSHFFNFKGPNMVVDTACSSSLVSLHLACRGILSGECEIAMAGGVDILLDEIPYVELSEGKALSPTGKCYTFDKRANGFVPGEGAGAVLLKPLDKAIADGDRIYAVFEGSAVNNDGHTMGITTPNLDAQVEVIREALADARLNARDISLIESHGTATMIGDPIELKGLKRAFGQDTQDHGFCALSSVKTNMGHLLSAAGIASVIKVALAIHHRRIPASLHCETPNPRFDFSSSPFYVQTQSVDWNPGRLLHAGMSGFGFGGTNAHVILGEPDPALMANYRPTRAPLPAPEFHRKAFWLEKPNLVKREAPSRMQTYDSTPAYDQLLDFDKIL
jgi:acyl transferase domain-containing protein/acyl carrier protein